MRTQKQQSQNRPGSSQNKRGKQNARPESRFSLGSSGHQPNDDNEELRQRRFDLDYNKAYFPLNVDQAAGVDAQNIDMAESQALHAADSVLDVVLNNGGKHLYEQYLQPKLKPHMVATMIQMYEIYSTVSKLNDHLIADVSQTLDMKQDHEPADKEVYDELWTDDGEPVSFESIHN